jgi:hypothetical protein
LTFSTQTGTIVNANKTSGRSSVWLERYLGVVEAARSSRVAPTSKTMDTVVVSIVFLWLDDNFDDNRN